MEFGRGAADTTDPAGSEWAAAEGPLATLLIIDDSDRYRGMIRRDVEASGIFSEVIEAADGLKGLRILLEKTVDMVLCRLELAGLDGAKLLLGLAENPSRSAAPIVYLTSQDDGERRARLLEGGASDVMILPVHPPELIARLRIHLQLKQLQDDLRIKDETLVRLSTVDGLTGLQTQRYADEVLSTEFLRAKRYGNSLTVMVGDLDHFKRINDDHGHLAGEAMLRGVAAILLDELRETDVAGRYGGEGIVVILSPSETSGAKILGERWREAVADSRFAAPDGKSIGVTLSVGVASLTEEMTRPESLIDAADAALCRAKNAGRNRVEVAGPGRGFNEESVA